MFKVILKHKIVLVISLLLGFGLAFGTLYRIKPAKGGGLTYEPRSFTTFYTSKTILVDQPGFALGRSSPEMVNRYEYEPTIRLAKTYSYLITSTDVLSLVKRQVGGRIEAAVTARAVYDSPIIRIRAVGTDPRHVRKVVEVTAGAFKSYLKTRQETNKIPKAQRIVIRSLGPAKPPVPMESRKWQIAFLAFLLPVAGGTFVSFSLENVSGEDQELRQA